jgi:uncharacterized protein YcbK (DUF882 family)
MSWIQVLKHPNAALVAVVLFLLALVSAPNAMSSIRRNADPLATVQMPEVVVTPEDVSTANPALVGDSGSLRAVIGTPAALEANAALEPYLADPSIDPGVHPLDVRASDGESLVAVATQPFDAAHSTEHEGYFTGRWASTGLAAKNPTYAPPQGYIRVTPENENTPVSQNFKLADFLTHDQQGVWPKVLVLQPRLLDKLELIGAELQRRGLPSQIHIMSGFRTPQYNAQEVGPGGRAENSRHQYGDASDIFVDANGDQRMDDLNHDGRIDKKDAQVLMAVAEDVEAQHPELVGGLSAYPSTSTHGPFVHVDARGTRARW